MIGRKKIGNSPAKPMILRKMMRKILCGNFEKSFLEWDKMSSRKVFRQFSHALVFFMFILLISTHTAFLIQFEINLHLWVETALAKAARAISAFWKTHSCKLIQIVRCRYIILNLRVRFQRVKLHLRLIVVVKESFLSVVYYHHWRHYHLRFPFITRLLRSVGIGTWKGKNKSCPREDILVP